MEQSERELAEAQASAAASAAALEERERELLGLRADLDARSAEADEQHADVAAEQERLAVLDRSTPGAPASRDAAAAGRDGEAAREHDTAVTAAAEAGPEPLMEPVPAREPAGPHPYLDLARLERLVDERGSRFAPDRVDAWRYYLLFLREHADLQGRLPEHFADLVDEEFGELLGGG